MVDTLVTYLLLLIGFISSKLNIYKKAKLGKFLSFILILLSSKRKKITLENIALSFPDKDSDFHNYLMKKSYENLGIVLAEVSAMNSYSDEELHKYVKCENIELINELHSKGKGLLILSGHYGNWELMAYAIGKFCNLSFNIIAIPQKNESVNQILNNYRTKGGNKVFSMYNAARKVIDVISTGGIVAILADQTATADKDIFVDFFGRPAATYEGPASLALRYRIPIVYGYAERMEDCSYHVQIKELKFDDLEYSKENIVELTKRHVKVLEDQIRKKPEFWSWQHRRWKHKPQS